MSLVGRGDRRAVFRGYYYVLVPSARIITKKCQDANIRRAGYHSLSRAGGSGPRDLYPSELIHALATLCSGASWIWLIGLGERGLASVLVGSMGSRSRGSILPY